MTESVLQQQAAKCREAQKNLDEATVELNAKHTIRNNVLADMKKLQAELADVTADLNAAELVHRYATEAVTLTINEMHRTLDKASPYGASRAMTEDYAKVQCAKNTDNQF